MTESLIIHLRDGAQPQWMVCNEDGNVIVNDPGNRKKGNRLPREVSMHPRSRPSPPGPTVFIRIASPRVPATWEPYLPTA